MVARITILAVLVGLLVLVLVHVASAQECRPARKITCTDVRSQSCEQLMGYAHRCGVGRTRQLLIATRCRVLHCVAGGR